MSRIGIYAVDSTELSKPPSDREYEQRGLYDAEEGAWDETTDTRLKSFLPDDGDQKYSFEEIQETVESSTIHVYLEDEVPGTVMQPPTVANRYQSASD